VKVPTAAELAERKAKIAAKKEKEAKKEAKKKKDAEARAKKEVCRCATHLECKLGQRKFTVVLYNMIDVPLFSPVDLDVICCCTFIECDECNAMHLHTFAPI